MLSDGPTDGRPTRLSFPDLSSPSRGSHAGPSGFAGSKAKTFNRFLIQLNMIRLSHDPAHEVPHNGAEVEQKRERL
jgi:hypothetical protein